MQFDSQWLDEQAQRSLARLLPRIQPLLSQSTEAERFIRRLQIHFPALFRHLHALYGSQYDFFYYLEEIIRTAAQQYIARSSELKSLDRARENDPEWFQSQTMMGAVCYVDLFAGDLDGIRERIPYFRELGLTYLHLMPLFRAPERNNDGGYAVSSFREVNPSLGTMAQLAELTHTLRENGISLVVDFVFNHTSDEHEWAQRALAGDAEYQAYYRMFDDRTLPDQYEAQLREIFPDQAPGSFTYQAEIDKWAWTTFYPFQWDLNYANPAVFRAILDEMLFLANQGIEVLRLDAVPFIWKRLGTNSENLPEAHTLIRAYNSLMRIAAPALLFKSEAIVHPRDVRSYIAWEECPLSYNPIMMVSVWEALATRQVRFFTHTMNKQFQLPKRTAWINYIRSHDDIGWGFADEDAAEVGINGYDHRYFLNQFYTGKFRGSFATGLPFNYNPRTGDMRISGTCASLAGLEQALALDNPQYIENAIRRILLIDAIILSAGGIPLIYLGDELGTLNDYSYRDDPAKADDSRWVHRPKADPRQMARRQDGSTIEGRIFTSLQRMIAIRKQTEAFANGDTRFFHTGSDHILGYTRQDKILVLANFSDFEQSVSINRISSVWKHLFNAVDLLTNLRLPGTAQITLAPYQVMWLAEASQPAQ